MDENKKIEEAINKVLTKASMHPLNIGETKDNFDIFVNSKIIGKIGGRIAPKISKEDFAEKLFKLAGATSKGYEYNGDYYNSFDCIFLEELMDLSKVEKDLCKIEFDTENISCVDGYVADDYHFDHFSAAEDEPNKFQIGIHTAKNGLTYLGVNAGGDWEQPLGFIIYFDGKSFRGYIPTAGNVFNAKTKKAFGNDKEEDANFLSSEFGIKLDFCEEDSYNSFYSKFSEQLACDCQLMMDDIVNRIEVI